MCVGRESDLTQVYKEEGRLATVPQISKEPGEGSTVIWGWGAQSGEGREHSHMGLGSTVRD